MRCALLVGALLALLLCAPAAAAPSLPAYFTDTTVDSGLTHPTAIRFAPDGHVFVAQKDGRILVYDSLSDTTPTVFADLRTNVDDYWDRGLLGLALDPSYPSAPYVYALYTYDHVLGDAAPPPKWSDACPTPPGPTANGCVVSARLVRLTASGTPPTATASQVLIEGWCQQFPSHSIGTLNFGPDGALYVSAGDGASFDFADYGQRGNACGDPPGAAGTNLAPPDAQGGALRAQSPRRSAGQPRVLDGAILRVDPATGAALPDNPLAGSADANERRIVAYGLRNPFRFTFRPGTSELWAGDVGWNDWEEIDRAPSPATHVENFGWPCYEGSGTQGGYQGIGLTSCATLAPSDVTAPYFSYKHGQAVVTGDGCGTGGSSIAGLAFYPAGAYPAAYDGGLFFSDYSRNCIWFMPQGAGGLPDASRVQPFLSGGGGPVNLEIGPGGDLFYPGYDDGAIHRITYHAPTARATATPSEGAAPLTVTFDGSGSSDPDGDPLTYAWDLDGDGEYDDATSATASYTYAQPGVYTARLRVSDGQSTGVSDPLTITVGGPPSAAIATPAPGQAWSVGDTIAFSGSGRDSFGNALPADALTWTLLLHHCPNGVAACHVHEIQTFAGVAGGTFTAPDHDYPSYLELELTARDRFGLTDTHSVRLDPRTVRLTFASDPPGLSLAVGSEAGTTPFTRTVIVGSTNGVSAAARQTRDGIPYAFVRWSDGGAAAHDLTAPAAAATYTASYRATRVLSVAPARLAFAAVAGRGDPAPAMLRIADPGPDGLSYTATGDRPWLAVAPARGAAPARLTVRAAIRGLAPGTHTGHVTLTAAGALGSPLSVPVTLMLSRPAPSGAPRLSPRPEPAAALLLGTTRIGAHSIASPHHRALGFAVRGSRSGLLHALRVYLDRRSTARRVLFGLYAERRGRPGRLLTQGALERPRAGAWNALPRATARLRAGRRYWIVLLAPRGTLRVRFAARNCSMLVSRAPRLRALPRSWRDATRRPGCRLSVAGWDRPRG